MASVIAVFSWIFAHWMEIGAALGFLMGAGRLLAKFLRVVVDLTEATWDNALVDKFVAFLELFEGLLRKLGLELQPLPPDTLTPEPPRQGIIRRFLDAWK